MANSRTELLILISQHIWRNIIFGKYDWFSLCRNLAGTMRQALMATKLHGYRLIILNDQHTRWSGELCGIGMRRRRRELLRKGIIKELLVSHDLYYIFATVIVRRRLSILLQ